MYKDNKIAVVVPAYNEKKLIRRVLDTIPFFVDWIIVVDDASTDDTGRVAEFSPDSRVTVIRHEVNRGVGGAIITGHKKALKLGADISVVMAGDAQMNPKFLPNLIDPLIEEAYDYTKGNRFLTNESVHEMPKTRVLGNIMLTFFTKLASGYWNIFDPQNGYTAIKANILKNLNLDRINKRYEFENDMLVNLNIRNCRVKDVAIPAVYGDEVSGIELYKFVPRTILLLTHRFFKRINEKYILRNFHPIALFLFSGSIISLIGFLYGIHLVQLHFHSISPSAGTVMLSVIPLTLGYQLLLIAFVLDIIETPK